MYTCVYTHTHTYTHIYTYTHTHKCVYIYVYMCRLGSGGNKYIVRRKVSLKESKRGCHRDIKTNTSYINVLFYQRDDNTGSKWT